MEEKGQSPFLSLPAGRPKILTLLALLRCVRCMISTLCFILPAVMQLFSEKYASFSLSSLRGDQRSPESLLWFREAELKHGRVSMLAVLGFVVPEFVRVPGEQFSFEAIPRVIDAHDKLPQSMIQIFGWISFLEACSWAALANMNEFDRKPGDFGFDPLKLYPTDPEKQKEMQLKELKNGRLAMVAIGGMVHGAIVTGHGFPYLP